jgi:hypothetical protein
MKVNIVSVDDWEALYIDDKKVDEGHSLRLEDVLKHLGIEFKSQYLEPDPDEGDGEWYFADNIHGIVFEPYEDD